MGRQTTKEEKRTERRTHRVRREREGEGEGEEEGEAERGRACLKGEWTRESRGSLDNNHRYGRREER